jgi:hypothetical protein
MTPPLNEMAEKYELSFCSNYSTNNILTGAISFQQNLSKTNSLLTADR